MTLLIEIDDPALRAVKLRGRDLQHHVYTRLDDGPRVTIGIDHTGLAAETGLTREQRRALDTDLARPRERAGAPRRAPRPWSGASSAS